jgi:predicted phage tail protein
MKTIILGGKLGKLFGEKFVLDVHNAKEACRAIGHMVDGFEKYMLNAHTKGMRFAVWHGDTNVGENELVLKTAADTIRIDPIIGGSKAGVLQVVLGVVLMVAGFAMNGVALGSGTALMYAGFAMVVGGVATMLIPPIPSTDQNQDGNKPNKGFGGAVTTVAQGNPVPLLYGERGVGGFVISGEIVPEDKL